MVLAEILAIGDELIHGHGTDTNSGWIARELEQHGLEVRRHVVVSDEPTDLADAIKSACERARLVVATGGLGPTEDDRTREAAAAAAATELVFDEAAWRAIQREFSRRGVKPPKSNRQQAMRPRTAEMLENRWGTAPGLMLSIGEAHCFILPGVPGEMRAMLEAHVLPRLPVLFPAAGSFAFHRLHVLGPSEAELCERLAGRMVAGREPRVGVTAHFGLLTIRIAARGQCPSEAAARAEQVAAELRPLVGDVLVHEGDETLAERVGAELIERDLSLVTAESCTGGLLSARLTDLPGISRVFSGGFVCYSDAAKQHELGVPGATLARHGAVSTEVAAAMADGAARRGGARLAVSITGIAGPGGGSADRPVGTVCFGLCRDGVTDAWQRRFSRIDRRFTRERAVLEALAAILERLKDLP